MAKVQPPKKLNDHSIPAEYRLVRGKRPSRDAKALHRGPTTETRDYANCIPGERPREEPTELPRLFIRGTGGSIKMDLSGLGFELSTEASAFTMPDESLSSLHIHAGDIAIIQPLGPKLCEGIFLLVQDGPQQTIRRLAKRGKIWFLEVADGESVAARPLLDQGIEGVVLGFVRLFEPIKPVPFLRPDSFFAIPRERNSRTERFIGRRKKPGKEPTGAKPGYRAHKKSPVLLAAEGDKGSMRTMKPRKRSFTPPG